jgi:UDP-N-acetylmuramate dehydrogenase
MEVFRGLEHIVTPEEPLAPHTWFRLGGAAEYFCEPTNEAELAEVVRRCREEDLPVRLLGGGSNLLVRDAGVPGVVLRLAAPAFCGISVAGNTVTAGGGARLGHVISTAVREGLAGLEPLVAIPGTVGGALHGNAEGHGGDIGQWTARAVVMTRSGEIVTRERDDLRFAYRQSSLDELVILSADLALEPEDPQQLTKRMQKLWIVTRSRQPPSDQHAGCIFKNPGGIPASGLIEQAGLKGASIGGAEVSDRDANFIMATPGAAADDVLRLIELVRTQVHERLGVDLETAIEIW